MFKITFIFIFVFSVFVVSCKKKKGDTLFNITYQVDVFVVDSLNITYYSDYHFASGNIDLIYPLDETSHNLYLDNTVWVGTRTTSDKEEGYYVKVNYGDLTIPTGVAFGVRVYANDTILIESKEGDASTTSITVEGKVPNFFK